MKNFFKNMWIGLKAIIGFIATLATIEYFWWATVDPDSGIEHLKFFKKQLKH